MIDPPDSSGSLFLTDRRNCGRLKVLSSSVVIGENIHGRVLNISPNGLALQTDAELIEDELPIRFHFPKIEPGIETRGRIAWRSASSEVVGIEFIGPADEVCQEIQSWIASQRDSSEGPKARMSLEEAQGATGGEASSEIATSIPARAASNRIAGNQSLSAETQHPERVSESPMDASVTRDSGAELVPEDRSQRSIFPSFQSPSETANAEIASENAKAAHVKRGSGKAGWLVGLSLAAALLVLAILPLRHYLQNAGTSQKGRETTTEPSRPGLSSKISATPSSNPGSTPDHSAPTSNPGSTPDHVAFVLQVGAMANEENANALASSLSQLNFPAFVFQGPTDRLHFVFVGPFTSVDATLTAKKDLERRGLKPFRTQWKPASQ